MRLFSHLLLLLAASLALSREQGRGGTAPGHMRGVLGAAAAIRANVPVRQDDRAAVGYDGGKCGFWIPFELTTHWEELSPGERAQARAILAPAVSQKNRVIGHFRFYYDTTGVDAASLITIDANDLCQLVPNSAEAFIDSAGVYFNHAWDFEISGLGYPAPPLDADGSYHVTVRNLGTSGEYGQTNFGSTPINSGVPSRYLSSIDIDNTFCNIYPSSRGLPALKVTAAHEFHHAIQIGGYGVWPSDLYFYEITSTWMEGVVYPEVRDYLQYEKDAAGNPRGQFLTPDITFTATQNLLQYSRALWGKFVEKRFGRLLMRRTWEQMATTPSLPSIDNALKGAGSSFQQAFVEWAVWNFHTGVRSDNTLYYPEGDLLPLVSERPLVEYQQGTERALADTLQATSSAYRHICLTGPGSPGCAVETDKMLLIVTNFNQSGAFSQAPLGFQYVMSGQGDNTFKLLSNGVYVRLDVPDPQNWATQEGVPATVSDVFIYPDPFYARAANTVKFRLPPSAESRATLSVFTSSMAQVFSQEEPILFSAFGEPRLEWNGTGSDGRQAGTGVYVFVITLGANQYTGKFSLIRE